MKAEKIPIIKNTKKKEELYRFLKKEIPGFGQYLSLDRQGEIVLAIIKICK